MMIEVFSLGDIYRIECLDGFNGCIAVYRFSKINTKDCYYIDKSRVCIIEQSDTAYIKLSELPFLYAPIVTLRQLKDDNWVVVSVESPENKPPIQDKKFTLTNEFKVVAFGSAVVYRIKALKTFGNVQEGDLGGWVEKEENLSQKGECWIADEAVVIGNAKVMDDTIVKCHALVREEAVISDQAVIADNAAVYGNAHISGRSRILGSGTVYGDAMVTGVSVVRGHVTGDASVENSYINANTIISGGSILRNFDYPPHGKYNMYASELRDIRHSEYLMAEEQDIISIAEIFFKDLEDALREKGLSDTDILDVILQYYTIIKDNISHNLKEHFNKES